MQTHCCHLGTADTGTTFTAICFELYLNFFTALIIILSLLFRHIICYYAKYLVLLGFVLVWLFFPRLLSAVFLGQSVLVSYWHLVFNDTMRKT